MNPVEYIKSELEIFIKRFSKVRVRYEHDKKAIIHTIEIVPNEIYHMDDEYILWESEMFDKFVALYPTENICFISDDALVGIENAIYIKEGIDFALFSAKKASFSFDLNLILVEQVITKRFYNITFAENKVFKPIEETKVTNEHNNYCKTFSLAA